MRPWKCQQDGYYITMVTEVVPVMSFYKLHNRYIYSRALLNKTAKFGINLKGFSLLLDFIESIVSEDQAHSMEVRSS